jgi:molecular chaperone DnaJ
MFGDFFGAAGRARAGTQPHRGRDVQVDLDLTFEQAFDGTSTRVEIDRAETCSVCKGTGAKPPTTPTTCPTCGGTGQVAQAQGMFGFSRTCPRCGGSGRIIEHPCSACHGTGTVVRPKPVTVNVPAGATEGGKLRFKGKGEAGAGGGPPGDLYVVTHIRPHPLYRRDGADVVVDLPISYPEAVLGTKVTVPAPDGSKVKLKVPPGTQPDRVFRIKGKGAPRLKGPGAGDLKVKAKLVVPAEVDERQRELLEKLAESNGNLRDHLT